MSGYYYPPHTSPPEEEEFDFTPSYPLQGGQTQGPYQTYIGQPTSGVLSQQQFYGKRRQFNRNSVPLEEVLCLVHRPRSATTQ